MPPPSSRSTSAGAAVPPSRPRQIVISYPSQGGVSITHTRRSMPPTSAAMPLLPSSKRIIDASASPSTAMRMRALPAPAQTEVQTHASLLHMGRGPQLAQIIGLLLVVCILIGGGFATIHVLHTVALTHASGHPPAASISQAKSQATAPPTSAHAGPVVRIDQSDPAQYASQAEWATWWPSTCSAASMTEVINAYGHHYRLTDILKVEAGLGAITPAQGLLTPQGIDQTAAQFGFATRTLSNPTLDQVLSLANSGTPVIVNFPPSVWPGGHFLLVVGSITQKGVAYVHLVDSSKLNMQYMQVGSSGQKDTFLYYWRGLAKVLTPTSSPPASGSYSVVGPPTLSADFINRVLAAYQSPASGKGQALYDLGVQYGIDPAFALAFFFHESDFGTAGEARMSLSLGNLRCIANVKCQDGYAWFPTWEAGFEAWYKLIRTLYVNQWGLVTIQQIIPKYAPPSDNNDDAAYIAALEHAIDAWHAGHLQP